ncbi:spore germination protein [Aneurinibacillus sp. Ricciae_BoGa-3]|uniref:spore germination protein n=1 Tax=Aneurinibacillus sp. Ricciae_BoGa-3 TaxID=3022697 RepID=UPI00234132C4|nr:spore germination protein [Aneurinibacillus sp. Ricciae_BoGa-3]WCK55086.1 spore germination protein [Aneurinibacillus sp. Ricciae_BoGa-3]
MPSFIGGIIIGTMDNGATIVAEKTAVFSPKTSSSSNSGSGFGNTADFMKNFNGTSSTNTNRPHVADQNITSAV